MTAGPVVRAAPARDRIRPMRNVHLFVLGGALMAGSAAAQSVPTVPEQVTVQVSGSTVTLSWAASFANPATYIVEAG